MPFDGLVTRGIVNQLKDRILYGKIDKIYQPEKNELVFYVHTDRGKVRLYISCDTGHPGLYLTEDTYQNPETPSGFCMLLRKHLTGARITDISQLGWERIVEISFETRNELGFDVNRKLIIEIMGKHSNIIFVEDPSMRIIDSIKRLSIDVNRTRQVLPGFTYEYPPSQDKKSPDQVTSDDFLYYTSSGDILRSIQGISPVVSRELAEAADGAGMLSGYLDAIERRDFTSCVYLDGKGAPADFHIIPLPSYDGLERLSFPTVSETISYFYSNRESSNRVRQKSSDLVKHLSHLLKKLYHKKQNLLEDILQAEKADIYRLYGELLTANLHSIRQGDSLANVVNYYDGTEISIPLDRRFSPSKNAQIYYRKYSKAKTAIVEKQIQIEKTDQDIIYLESVLALAELAEDTQTIDNIRDELISGGYMRRRKQSSKAPRTKEKFQPYTYTTSDGFRICAGRNNRENDMLTLKKASRNDIWFHTKDIPGSHTILFTEGKEPSDLAVFQAAAVAAYHSKGRMSENVPVDYTQVKHVKKPAGGKPGMVIFTNNRTVYVTPALPEKENQK